MKPEIIPAPTPTAAVPVTVDRSGAQTDRDLAELWLRKKQSDHTRRSYARTAADFLDYLEAHGSSLRDCTAMVLQGWFETQKGKPATVAQRASVVRSLLSFGHKTGYLLFNVGATLDLPSVPDESAERLLSREEVFKLFEHATPRAEPVLRLLYYSAARISELCQVQWRHVHRDEAEGATVTLHGKGGKTRHVHLEPEQAAVLWELKPERADDGAFVLATRTGKPLHPSEAANMVKRAVVAAGLGEWAVDENGKRRKALVGTKASPHWLRHAHASHAFDAGAPAHLVQKTLGHASLATTSRYAHPQRGESSSKYLKG